MNDLCSGGKNYQRWGEREREREGADRERGGERELRERESWKERELQEKGLGKSGG
jgi:hypothetical protein